MALKAMLLFDHTTAQLGIGLIVGNEAGLCEPKYDLVTSSRIFPTGIAGSADVIADGMHMSDSAKETRL